MKHLSREELIDSLERTLPAGREAHVDTCPTCRAERASLQQVLQRVASVEVPEPSPLFWEHFGARVREAVARQPEPSASGWTSLLGWHSWGWPRWAAATATLVLCLGVGWASWDDYRRLHPIAPISAHLASGTTEASDAGPGPAAASTASPDEGWNLVVSMAEDVTVDDADEPGLAVRPAAMDGAFTDLSPEQRSELARLLTDEMTRPAS